MKRVRRWVLKFGPVTARRLRQQTDKPEMGGLRTMWQRISYGKGTIYSKNTADTPLTGLDLALDWSEQHRLLAS